MNFILDIIASGLGWYVAFTLYSKWQEYKSRKEWAAFEADILAQFKAADDKLNEELGEKVGKVAKKAAKKKAVQK